MFAEVGQILVYPGLTYHQGLSMATGFRDFRLLFETHNAENRGLDGVPESVHNCSTPFA